MIEIRHHPSHRELLVFGALLALFTLLVGLMFELRFEQRSTAHAIWVAGGALTAIHFLVPPIRRPLYLAWMFAAYPIGWTLSHALLALIYYSLVTPIGLLLRLFGYDPLRRRFDPEAESYWVERRTGVDSERYFQQF